MVNKKYIFLAYMFAFMVVYVGSIFYGTSIPIIASQIDDGIEIPQSEFTDDWNSTTNLAATWDSGGVWTLILTVLVLGVAMLSMGSMKMGMG